MGLRENKAREVLRNLIQGKQRKQTKCTCVFAQSAVLGGEGPLREKHLQSCWHVGSVYAHLQVLSSHSQKYFALCGSNPLDCKLLLPRNV